MTAPFEVVGSARAPEPSHLTAEQVAHLRAILVKQVFDQHQALAEQDEALSDATVEVVESAVTSERELAQAFVQFTKEASDELEAAVGRIDEGGYGVCESCATPIPFERLEAVPEARFCVGCPRPRGLFG